MKDFKNQVIEKKELARRDKLMKKAFKFKPTKNKNEIAIVGWKWPKDECKEVEIFPTFKGKRVVEIGKDALSGARYTHIIIPNTITSIHEEAFASSNIEKITIPDSVTYIGRDVFRYCSNLKEIRLGCGLSKIEFAAFLCYTHDRDKQEPKSLNVYVNDFDVWNQMNFGAPKATPLGNAKCWRGVEHKVNLYINERLVEGDFVIPSGTKSINDYLFLDCKGIKSVTIPNGVTSIGRSAFSGCENLTSIAIPDSVTSIGRNAFSGCENLTSITIPDGVVSISEYAFRGCKNLTNITLPSSVKVIHDFAFYGCEKLTSITLPHGLVRICSYAFSGCKSLTNVKIPSSVRIIDNYAFKDCENLKNVPGFKIGVFK